MIRKSSRPGEGAGAGGESSVRAAGGGRISANELVAELAEGAGARGHKRSSCPRSRRGHPYWCLRMNLRVTLIRGNSGVGATSKPAEAARHAVHPVRYAAAGSVPCSVHFWKQQPIFVKVPWRSTIESRRPVEAMLCTWFVPGNRKIG